MSPSPALEVRAEILKLARLLGREPDEFSYLEQIPARDIRALREQITDLLFTAHGNTLGRLATASKLLPVPVVATIGEQAFGPVLSARVAGMLEPARAVAMAERLPVEFLADVAVDIDPRRASDVIGQIPPERVAAVTRELVSRSEYVTMGRFVGHLGDEAIAAALGELHDEALLRIAFVLEEPHGFERLLDLLPVERFDGIIDAALEHELFDELAWLLELLPPETRGRVDATAQTLPSYDAIAAALQSR